MAGDSVITEELRKTIGVAKQSTTIDMEKGMLRKFVDAIEDPNPLWSDEGYAKKTKYGGITFPPSILAAAMMGGSGPRLDIPLGRILDGVNEFPQHPLLHLHDQRLPFNPYLFSQLIGHH